jgi:hypothetical protein
VAYDRLNNRLCGDMSSSTRQCGAFGLPARLHAHYISPLFGFKSRG